MELRMVEAAAAETEHILLVLLDQWLLHTVEQVVVAVEEAKDLVLTVQQIPEVAVAGVVQAEH
jgi:peptidyl-tRNA hydrolase